MYILFIGFFTTGVDAVRAPRGGGGEGAGEGLGQGKGAAVGVAGVGYNGYNAEAQDDDSEGDVREEMCSRRV